MGHWISMNFLEISDKTNKNSILGSISYNDIDEDFINKLIKDDKIKTIQISKSLPEKAYQLIDCILERKPELYFRVYDLRYHNQYDISFLKDMPHLQRLTIDAHLDGWNDVIDFNILTELNLKSLHLNAFDLKDYSFIQNLSGDIEELVIMADGMSSSVKFDCKWLLQYNQLSTLWLGKNAKKNIDCLSKMKSLKSLSLRGIKLKSFEFLNELKLEKLELLWNSNNDLEALKELESLKEIGLWRINKLDNIDFISNLINLEVIKLQDLRHLTKLPDLSHLTKLKKIILDNTGISINDFEEPYKAMVERYWR